MQRSKDRSIPARIAKAVLMDKQKIVVGISGGIDSAHTAKLLLEEGYDVVGVYLVMHDEQPEAFENAKKVAKELGIELVFRDARNRFDEIVVKNFLDEYKNGRTPNPCVVCNRHVKLFELCECAKELGAKKVATGHYVKIARGDNGRYTVLRPDDKCKDQSYMLWGLTQDMLSMLITPLCSTNKAQLKKESELSVSKNKESQEICFIPDDDYVRFIESRVPSEELLMGNFVDKNGSVLGAHKGIHRYTIGQRRHLGIALGQRCFVTDIDPKSGDITLGFGGDEYFESFVVSNINIVGGIDGNEYCVKTRYRAAPEECRVEFLDDNSAIVYPKTKLRAITKGQSAVFYCGDAVAFGGIIER